MKLITIMQCPSCEGWVELWQSGRAFPMGQCGNCGIWITTRAFIEKTSSRVAAFVAQFPDYKAKNLNASN